MNHWGGVSWRFEPSAFKALDVWGQVPGGAIANWPLSYEDLEPNYTKFEYRMGVSGDAELMPHSPPMSRPYPLPPLEQDYATLHFAEASKSLGYQPFPMPAAILSREYHRRQPTGYCGFCQGYECTVDAKSNTRNTEIQEAQKNPNFTFLTDRYVIQVTMNSTNQVDGVICLDSRGNSHNISASVIILSANTFYNIWLLLLSANHYAPGGIGNRYDQLGKYVHIHPRFGVNGLFSELMNVHIGPSEPLMAITDYTEDQFDHTGLGFVMGGYIYGARGVGTAGGPIEFAKADELPDGVPRWGSGFKQYLAETYNRYYQVHSMLTDPPMQGSFIDLDPHIKNGLGLPLPRLTFDWSPQLQNMYRFFRPKVVEILQAAGAIKIWGGELVPPWEITHPSGGTRMGDNPKESVTDRYGRIHGIRNLFVSGNSLFPTMSAFNVTETICAYAYWQADQLKALIHRGNLI